MFEKCLKSSPWRVSGVESVDEFQAIVLSSRVQSRKSQGREGPGANDEAKPATEEQEGGVLARFLPYRISEKAG